MLKVTILVIVLLVVIAVHEAAHALALRSLGIPISEAGIGLPIGPQVTIRPKGWPGFTFTISAVLLGAYVSPDPRYEAQLDKLTYRDSAWYLNAGVISNLVFGLGLLAVDDAVRGRPVRACICAAAAVLVWVFRRPTAAYIVPTIGTVAAVFQIIVGFVLTARDGKSGLGYSAILDIVPTSAGQLVAFVGAVSIAIGLLNMLPLYGLDNGKVIDLALRRWLPQRLINVYRWTGLAAIALIIAGSVLSDAWAALKAL